MTSEDASIIFDPESFVSDDLLEANTFPSTHTDVTDNESDTPPMQPELADQLLTILLRITAMQRNPPTFSMTIPTPRY